MLKDKLQIILITYNRIDYLKRTFNQIFAEDSPIKDFDITVLDNASDDGTSEFVEEYCQKFPNLKHIKHKINIGGNANICRAFELGVSSGKEYVWVLCDDDKYDFSNFQEVEDEINKKTDIICVSNYAFRNEKDYNLPEYLIFQLTFVPSGIYRTELITNNVMMNMYDAIYTMFQQSCITLSAINENKKIKVLSRPIVFNGLHFSDACSSIEFTRGVDEKKPILKRRKDTNWLLGYANVLSLLNDKKIAKKCIEIAISNKDIYNSKFEYYYNTCYYLFRFGKQRFNYFLEIWYMLSFKMKLLMALYIIFLGIPFLIFFIYENNYSVNIRILGKTIIRIPKK